MTGVGFDILPDFISKFTAINCKARCNILNHSPAKDAILLEVALVPCIRLRGLGFVRVFITFEVTSFQFFTP